KIESMHLKVVILGKKESFISHFIIRAKWNRRNRIIFWIVASAAIIYYFSVILLFLNEEITDIILARIYSILLIVSVFIMIYAVKGVKWVR
ncbi:hypothetical protein, partial [Caldiplasma sukawensis]